MSAAKQAVNLTQRILDYAATVEDFTTEEVINAIPNYAPASIRMKLVYLKRDKLVRVIDELPGRGRAYVFKLAR